MKPQCYFLLAFVGIIGCSYEPEHIDFEPFAPPEKIEQKVQELAKYMQMHPTDHTMLAEYGLALSERFQTLGSEKKENKYIQYDRIDSIVQVLIKNNGFSKILFEKHIYNILLFTKWFSISRNNMNAALEFNSLYTQPLKETCEKILINDPNSQTAAIGLCYYYKSMGLRHKYDSLVALISGWKQIPAAFWRANSSQDLLKKTIKILILKTGDPNRKVLSSLYGSLAGLNNSPTVNEISSTMAVPMVLLAVRYFPPLLNKKIIDNTILSLPFFLWMTQYYFAIRPYMKTEISFEEQSRYAVKTTEEIFYSSGFDERKQFIESAVHSGDTARLFRGLEKYLLQYQGTILPNLQIFNRDEPSLLSFLSRSQYGKIILINNKYFLFKGYNVDSSTVMRYLYELDSVKRYYRLNDRYITAFEIHGISAKYIYQGCSNDSLRKLIELYCSRYLEKTGEWIGSKYIAGLVINNREQQAKNYLKAVLSNHPEMREKILTDIVQNGMDILSYWYPDRFLGNEDDYYLKKVYQCIKNIASSDKRLTVHLQMVLTHEILTQYYSNDSLFWSFMTLDSILTHSERLEKRIGLLRILKNKKQFHLALYIVDELRKIENNLSPHFTLNRAIFLAKMGRKTESDSIFAHLESNNPGFIIQYAERAELLNDEGKKNESINLLLSKLPKVIDQAVLYIPDSE